MNECLHLAGMYFGDCPLHCPLVVMLNQTIYDKLYGTWYIQSAHPCDSGGQLLNYHTHTHPHPQTNVYTLTWQSVFKENKIIGKRELTNNNKCCESEGWNHQCMTAKSQ